MKNIKYLLFLILPTLLISCTGSTGMPQKDPVVINTDQLQGFINDYRDKKIPMVLIDGRGAGTYFNATIPGSIEISTADVNAKKGLLPIDKGVKIVCYCSGTGCNSSDKLARAIMALGYTNVCNYQPGFPDWITKKGYFKFFDPTIETNTVKSNENDPVIPNGNKPK